MKNIIYLIEDCTNVANDILQKLQAIAQQKNNEEHQYEFVFLEGTEPGILREKQYLFYEDGVLEQIQTHFHNTQHDSRMCILLDYLLQKEDYGQYNLSEQGMLAKKIYFTYKNEMPIYFITDVEWFATQSDVKVGVDLSEQFIPKSALLQYEIKDEIDRIFKFYQCQEIANA